ncbi:VOC family protein [Microbacterium oxydans]|uniref:VOC family protein n=1 Tax=Microbacterium oxydans TaxID=82380 RepID=UPI00226B4A94|nr:VOC family protein [Microbacterium oxydans]WAA65864.1 VOC family protein [Microbacterium oxydans]
MTSDVSGIGGLFFRSRDPEARADWYKEHLGISAGHTGIWQQEPGMTVFAPFPADSDYFAADQQFMLNLRVADIEQLAARLESEGIPVERRDEWNTAEYGTFARIHDPEGLAIELWQPPAESA